MKNLSFKRKMQLIVGGLSALAFTAFGVSIWHDLKEMNESKSKIVSDAAGNIIDKVDRNLFERYGDVQAFALSEPARSMDPKRISAFINDMMPTYAPIYDVMLVTDTKGKVIATNTIWKDGKPADTSYLLGKDYSDKPWFKAAVDGKIAPATSFVEDMAFDEDIKKVANNDGRVMNFTAPIVDKKTGKVLGVWSNRVSWKDVVEAIFAEEIAKIKGGRITDVFPYIISSEGKYLLHADPKMIFAEARDLDYKSEFLKANVETEKFQGQVFQSNAKSKGYSTYPGIAWTATLQAPVNDARIAFLWYLVGIAATVLIGFNVFAHIYATRSSRLLEDATETLSQGFKKLNDSVTIIQQDASKLAEAVTEQAAAIEETVASMEEMTSMIAQTSQHANGSSDVATRGAEESENGKKVIGRMIHSMDEIQSGNSKLQEIVKLIEEIKNRTKVINDIVFETRLLAFNASIEAARAGAHGKGFAVVAEEVGKLASMSGKAADEIRNLLETSTSQVATVVSQTSEKINQGRTVTTDCEVAFNSMGSILSRIQQSVGSINSATKEQEVGVRQTNKAMQEMDKVVQVTAKSADYLEKQALSLRQGTAEMKKVLDSIQGFIYGETPVAKTASSFVQNGEYKNPLVEQRMQMKNEVVPSTNLVERSESVVSQSGDGQFVSMDPVESQTPTQGSSRWKNAA